MSGRKSIRHTKHPRSLITNESCAADTVRKSEEPATTDSAKRLSAPAVVAASEDEDAADDDRTRPIDARATVVFATSTKILRR